MEGLTDEKLAEAAAAGERAKEAMEVLYRRYLPVLGRMACRFGRPDEMEDLMQEGYVGLVLAAEHYRQEKGVPFRSYAVYWIRRSMSRYLEQCGRLIRIPSGRAELMRKYRRLAESWETVKGSAFPDREAACLMGISERQLRRLRQDMAFEEVESLEAPAAAGEENALESFLKGSEGPEKEILDKITGEELKRALWACVDELEREAAEAVRYRYRENMDGETAEDLTDTERKRIRFWLRKGLRELRKPEKTARLRPFLDAYDMGLRGTGVTVFHRTWTSATERAALRLAENITGGGADKRKEPPKAHRGTDGRRASGGSR